MVISKNSKSWKIGEAREDLYVVVSVKMTRDETQEIFVCQNET